MLTAPQQAMSVLPLAAGFPIRAIWDKTLPPLAPADQLQLQYCFRYARRWLGARSLLLEQH